MQRTGWLDFLRYANVSIKARLSVKIRWLNKTGIKSKAYCIVVMALFVIAFFITFGFKITTG